MSSALVRLSVSLSSKSRFKASKDIGTDPEDRQAIVLNGWKNFSMLLSLILMMLTQREVEFDILVTDGCLVRSVFSHAVD